MIHDPESTETTIISEEKPQIKLTLTPQETVLSPEQKLAELEARLETLEENNLILQSENTELKEKLIKAIELAGIDPLTEIFNRRGGEERAKTYIEQAARGEIKLAYIRFDIDNFKEVNDTYGHPWGDEVLKALAKKVQEVMRGTDLLFRYGGEEFDLILSFDKNMTSSMKHIGDIVDRYLQSIRELMRDPKQTTPLTASFGVAIVEKGERFEIDEMQKMADLALYHAKHHGRDQIAVVKTRDIFSNPSETTVWTPPKTSPKAV